MIAEIAENLSELKLLCEKHGVIRLALFGSAARDEFNPDSSDLDFLVLFDRMDEPFLYRRYFALTDDLERLLDRKVDLVSEFSARKPRFRAAIDKDLVLIYERASSQSAA